ncbi:MAG TPA: SRPBCC family protein [Longimicrobiales bacterium]|nr:SRPBCC family protein [Longimicrobiales bacterium]
MNTVDTATIAPVRKNVTVNATPEEAFKFFTDDFDAWWPKSHHIGSGVMTRAVIETKLGGRCYGEEADGNKCYWGSITAWEPPQRFVIAWQITPEWKYQPDLAKSSEVEVQFTAVAGGTRVDLEHRNFERQGEGGQAMRAGVDGEGGWKTLLQVYASTLR